MDKSKTVAEQWTAVRVRDDRGGFTQPGFMDPDAQHPIDDEYRERMAAQGLPCAALGVYRSCFVFDRGFCAINETAIMVGGQQLDQLRKQKAPPPAKKVPPPKKKAKRGPPPR